MYFTEAKDIRRVTVTCYPSLAAMVDAGGADPDLWICDEAHRAEAPEHAAASEALGARRAIALTATPFRAVKGLRLWDELVYRYSMSQALKDGVLCPFDAIPWEGSREDIDDVMVAMIRAHTEGPGAVDAASIEDAESFAERLVAEGISATCIHSQMHPAKQREAMQSLASGRVRVLVHVSMLVEGVDMPWLRWLGLRRRVGSRVRFLQQLGRVLRTHPGKDRAVILDPWGLCEAFDLEYDAELGYDEGAPDDTVAPPKDEQEWDLIELPPVTEAPLMVPSSTARRAVAAWARRCLHAATAAGARSPSTWEADATWRRRAASPKQVAALGKMAWATRGIGHAQIKAGIKAIVDSAPAMTAGAVSDLLDVLSSGAIRAKNRQPGWVSPLPVPPLPARVVRALAP